MRSQTVSVFVWLCVAAGSTPQSATAATAASQRASAIQAEQLSKDTTWLMPCSVLGKNFQGCKAWQVQCVHSDSPADWSSRRPLRSLHHANIEPSYSLHWGRSRESQRTLLEMRFSVIDPEERVQRFRPAKIHALPLSSANSEAGGERVVILRKTARGGD